MKLADCECVKERLNNALIALKTLDLNLIIDCEVSAGEKEFKDTLERLNNIPNKVDELNAVGNAPVFMDANRLAHLGLFIRCRKEEHCVRCVRGNLVFSILCEDVSVRINKNISSAERAVGQRVDCLVAIGVSITHERSIVLALIGCRLSVSILIEKLSGSILLLNLSIGCIKLNCVLGVLGNGRALCVNR